MSKKKIKIKPIILFKKFFFSNIKNAFFFSYLNGIFLVPFP